VKKRRARRRESARERVGCQDGKTMELLGKRGSLGGEVWEGKERKGKDVNIRETGTEGKCKGCKRVNIRRGRGKFF